MGCMIGYSALNSFIKPLIIAHIKNNSNRAIKERVVVWEIVRLHGMYTQCCDTSFIFNKRFNPILTTFIITYDVLPHIF